MQPHHYIALACLAALGWAFLVLVRRSPDDAESGTLIGQVSRDEDAFHHAGPQTADLGPQTIAPPHQILLRRCGWCHALQGEQAVVIFPSATFAITDGICPACKKKHFPLADLAEWAQDNTMLKVPAHLSPTL